jgi:hypothetical protein
MERSVYRMDKLRIVTSAEVWHRATENGPRTMDKSHTFAAYRYM